MTLTEERASLISKCEEMNALCVKENRDFTSEEQTAFDDAKNRIGEIDKTIESQNLRSTQIASLREKEISVRAVNPCPQSNLSASEERDLEKFSLATAIEKMSSRSGRMDGIEAEVFQEGEREARSKNLEFSAGACIISRDHLVHLLTRSRKEVRGLTSESGNLIAKEPKGIWEMFRSRLLLERLGATIFEGLVGDVPLNEQTAQGGTNAFIGETASATVMNPTIGTKSLSPHRVCAYTDVSTRLAKQSSPDVEAFVMNNLVESSLRVLQNAVMSGSVSDPVVGIPNLTGIHSYHVATADSPTWSEILKTTKNVRGKEIPQDVLGFVLNGEIETTLMSTPKASGIGSASPFIMSELYRPDGFKDLAGFKAGVSDAVGDNIIFGAWERLFIGMWGGIGLLVDPYTQATTGQIRMLVESFADAQVPNPANFSVLSMDVASQQ